jgi:hypothetical protein
VLTAERTVTRAGDVKEVLTAELRLENRLPFATEGVRSEVADMYPACCSARGPWP